MKNSEELPCTQCNGRTEVSVGETDVSKMPGFIEGTGVLCEKCFVKHIRFRSMKGSISHEDKIKMISEHVRRREKRRGNID